MEATPPLFATSSQWNQYQQVIDICPKKGEILTGFLIICFCFLMSLKCFMAIIARLFDFVWCASLMITVVLAFLL